EGSYTYYRNWAYIDAWGAGHPFYVDSRTAWGSCNGVPYSSFEVNATAADGSGYTIQTQDMGYEKAWITTPSGTAMYPPVNSSDSVASITDRNGNIISKGSGGFSDTLSTTTAALAISGLGTSSSPVQFTYQAPGASGTGVNAAVTVNYANYTVAT